MKQTQIRLPILCFRHIRPEPKNAWLDPLFGDLEIDLPV
jgi:hypothetical protein